MIVLVDNIIQFLGSILNNIFFKEFYHNRFIYQFNKLKSNKII